MQVQIVRVSVMAKPTRRVVYVAVGRVAGAELARKVAPVLIDDDNLLLGPSSADPKRHPALRACYWGGSPSERLDKELARTSDTALCVALPPTPGGLLSFCRVAATAAARGRLLFVIDLGKDAAVASPQGRDPAKAAEVNVAEALRRKPSTAERSNLEAALAATLWRLWCRRSPVAFSRFCASGSRFHPQLANLGRYHAGQFPRQIGQAVLLSRVDELVLNQLSREWLTPLELFVSAMKARTGLYDWFTHMGDLYLAKRLLEWSRHGHGRVVECREHPGEQSELKRWSFRWHARSETILEALPDLHIAPPVTIGGAVAYDAARAWVCRFDAGGTPYLSRRGEAAASTSNRRA
ncbi:hypothetical protein [Sorangium sp. So ce1099]|uniref:hypothetical protein n=1 Tax=Sorangium sp. So ce1099 TaxID=3133331 RepID=UPI003F623EF6